jgi:hypothetical protein
MSRLAFHTALPATLPLAPPAAANPEEQEVATSIHWALSAVESVRRGVERRREARHAYPYPIHLTPLDDEGRPDVDRTFVVIGKHLSLHGLDFYCRQPLPQRRVIASLDCGLQGWVGLVLELTWCRFGRHGLYDNGGRFLSVVRAPLLELDRRPRVG